MTQQCPGFFPQCASHVRCWRIDADDQIQLVDDHRQIAEIAELRLYIFYLNLRRKIVEILKAVSVLQTEKNDLRISEDR